MAIRETGGNMLGTTLLSRRIGKRLKRREFLRLGALGGMGLSLATLLRAGDPPHWFQS